MRKKRLKNTRWKIFIYVIILIIIGLIELYSTTQNTNDDSFNKQILWSLAGIAVMFVVYFVDYSIVAKISPLIYFVCIALLVAVLFTGGINGATSWFDLGFFSLQPGEFSKIFVIMFLSYVITMIQKKGQEEINKVWKLATILIIWAIPTVLIILEPDYGTAGAYLVSLLFILFVAGINKKYIIVAITLVVILVPLLYLFVLPEHAKSRITVYLNPNTDPRGAGYNIIQSKLAIGSGRLLGMGWREGTQTQLGFLYPKTTDFIFSAIAEEWGFIACSIIIIIYVLLLTEIIDIAKSTKDNLGSYIAIGIAGVFTFHVVENIGMTIGLLPITGIPLPFISYGGSSLITNFLCIGILLNITSSSQRNIFVE